MNTEGSAIDDPDSFGENIVVLTRRAEHVIGDVRQALVESDATALRRYVLELEALRVDLEVLLRAKVPEAPARER